MKTGSETRSETVINTKWIQYQRLSNHPSMRIFCFPYAGGSALFYARWFRHLDENAEVFPVQLPGRESRINEPLLRVMSVAIDSIVEEITPYLTEHMAFVGHSMGSMLVYEVVKSLAEKHLPLPEHVFLCGAVPPDLIGESEKIHMLSDEQFCEKLKGYESITSELMRYPEFFKFFLPVIKADFELIETYRPGAIWKMPCDVTICSGTEDPYVPAEYLAEWERYCVNPPEIVTYSGNHFFLKEHTAEICGLITERMKNKNNNINNIKSIMKGTA